MEQIILNVKQATEVSGNVNMFCMYSQLRDDLLKSDALIFTLHFPKAAPPAPRILWLLPFEAKA